ncbi:MULTISPECIES: DUF7144 family membrane protein [unclassified Leifsonia]|uniref:DUF7144 family membrane protein n=1 Tax=unclassified Leifsonia TaxID=2663824 RepID=UPI0007013F43|nr:MULTISPECIES: hypothetical protein [unclassified Leifsonia]KQX08064.1 hypothetical protein ASC59_10300 [Leifsonia sp. Root1293]KRA12345.1 hypothetical protein ASD61_10300 [Leifsonia sp. Root60]
MAYRRPVVVSIAGALTWLAGVIDIVIGVVLLAQSGVNVVVLEFGGAVQLFTAAIVALLFGAILFFAGGGVLSAKNTARIVATGAHGVSILASLVPALLLPAAFFGSWLGILASVVVIVLLYTRPANAYFRDDS